MTIKNVCKKIENVYKMEQNIKIPEGCFARECCANCGWSEYDAGANWTTYCNYKRTHVRADDYCGYYK